MGGRGRRQCGLSWLAGFRRQKRVVLYCAGRDVRFALAAVRVGFGKTSSLFIHAYTMKKSIAWAWKSAAGLRMKNVGPICR